MMSTRHLVHKPMLMAQHCALFVCRLLLGFFVMATNTQALEFSLDGKKPLFAPKPTNNSDISTEPLASDNGPRQQLGTFGGNVQTGVNGNIFVSDIDLTAGTATLIARFTPPDGYHLYCKSLPVAGLNGIGRPTLLEIADQQTDLSRGPLLASQLAREKVSQGALFPLYPKGPVEIHLPIHLPQGEKGSSQPIRVWLTYMTCNEDFCLRPMEREEVTISLPSSTKGKVGDWVQNITDSEADLKQNPAPTEATATVTNLKLGKWYYPQNVTELRALLDAAEQTALPAFLDFTGPSCLNCQIMKQTVFVLPSVQETFAEVILISLNTDPPYADLGDFQLETYGTFTRPFYVRTAPGDSGQSWSTFFRPGNSDELERFIGFLKGGLGDAPASADGQASSIEQSGGWGGFLLLAIFGGLFTLVMPCTYPMIPLTVNFFTKQGENGKQTWSLAATYAIGIIAFFVVVGLIFALIMGDNPAYFAGHWLTNLVIGLVFLLLGTSLIGVFFLRLPTRLMNLGGDRSGYAGALVMGLAFAVMSFTCTAPFAGLVLGSAALNGSWATAVIGMAVYASVIALPFFFLALAPKLLQHLPGSGAWMHEFKVVGGLIEIGASLKFLYMTDFYFGWGLIDRTTVLSAWASIAVALAIYVLGIIRLKDDCPMSVIGPGRLLLAIVFGMLALVFVAGLSGTHLGALEGLFP